jgi:hypothetical protein
VLYEIDLGNLKDVQAALARAPQLVREELEAAVTEADLLLVREVQERMPTAHGTLRASVFNREEVSDTGVLGLVSTPLNYAVPVELGTKPHFPPVDALVDWVKVKLGVTSEKTARGVAFLIARKISLRGTAAQRPFGLAFQAEEAQVRAIFDRAAARIAGRLAEGGA